jgi:outer membrane cobalamin receptor
MIDYDGGAAPTEPSYHNKASATASGQELELSARLPASFRTSFMVTRLRTNVKDPGFNPDPTALLVDGQRLVRRPNWTGSATLSYAHSGGASGEVRVSRMGDRDDRAYVDFSAVNVRLPWYTLLDVAGQLPLRVPGVGAFDPVLTARVSNFGNTRYESVAGFASPGRMFSIGLAARFPRSTH